MSKRTYEKTTACSSMLPRAAALVVAASAGALALGMESAQAAPVIFTGSSGIFSASVSFDVSGSNLLVTLTNTSLGDPSAPGDILTGVIFTLNAANTTLGKVSAVLAPGSSVKGNGGLTDPGGSVGGEWAYSNSLSGAFSGKQSIYSSGYFDGNARFPGNNLQGPNSVDGVQYGITTVNDTAGNDNGGLSGQGLIKNAVNFVLSGLPQGFQLSSIGNVFFQYGTSLEERRFPGKPGGGGGEVPEPATLGLLGSALVGLGLVRRKRR